MRIERIAVIGAGTMGSGIAQVSATSGYDVTLVDSDAMALERARQSMAHSAARLRSKGHLTDDQVSRLDVIQAATTLASIRHADLIIEAVTENLAVKKALFAELPATARPEAIFASNTSSISLTALATMTDRPHKVVGMHFMNPVPVMALIEVVRGLETAPETIDTVLEVSQTLGKTPVVVADYPGFVSNRILCPMLNEAMFALLEGVGTVEAIDTVLRLGMNHPMGPLMLADFIGLDVVLAVLDVLWDSYHDPKYRACPLLRKLVAAGHLGRKRGRGFYLYDDTGRPIGPAYP
jgi:3-hydroxybutyryl-CoA dehydrogenase